MLAVAATNSTHGSGFIPAARARGKMKNSARLTEMSRSYHTCVPHRFMLDYLAGQFSAALDQTFPADRSASRQECIDQVITITGAATFQPFMRVWWDIVAGCAAGNTAYLCAAKAIMDRLLQWVVDHLPADDPDPQGAARMALTYIEGAQMLRAVGRGDIPAQGLASLAGAPHPS